MSCFPAAKQTKVKQFLSPHKIIRMSYNEELYCFGFAATKLIIEKFTAK
jgi:hypothetical protein